MYVNGNPEHQELGQWVALATAIIGAASSAGLFSGKVHTSPWGFLYDDYPMKIWEAAKAVAEATGTAIPPQAVRTGGTAYQASMQAIVPPLFPGKEQEVSAQIKNYDRRLNEPGGYYELAYTILLDKLRSLVNQARTTFQAPPVVANPYAGAATPIIPQTPQPQFALPTQQRAFAQPQQPLQISQAGMFDMQHVTPFVLAGISVFALMMILDAKKGR